MPKKSFRLAKPPILVEKDEFGREFVQLDILTSHFYSTVEDFPLGLISESPDQMPDVGYIIPFVNFGLGLQTALSDISIKAEEGLEIRPEDTPELPSETVAIRIQVVPPTHAEKRMKQGMVKVSSGILKTDEVRNWTSWRLVSEKWARQLWQWTDFQTGKLEPSRYRPKGKQVAANFQVLKDFLFDTESGEKRALLATVALYFNSWRRLNISLKERASQLSQLGFTFRVSSSTIKTWSAEAGCEFMPRSLVLRELQKTRDEAYRYFETHLHELIEFKRYGFKRLIKVWLPHSDEAEMRARYIEYLKENDIEFK